MIPFRTLVATVLLGSAALPAAAVEGPTVAGPIGGTDVRSALPLPPGVYVGTVGVLSATIDFVDAHGNTIPALSDARLVKEIAGPFFYFVPQTKVLGGSLAIAGLAPAGNICGHLFAGTSNECDAGIGDPYVEMAWSRYFGTPRPSAYAGAYPIAEGLSVLLGFGAVLPVGRFNGSNPLSRAISIGSNLWDFAPTAAFTYTTRPILAEGTELSAKIYWNNYLENPETHYRTGDLMNVDFALTEHIGRFQVGVTGFYAWQVEDDKIAGITAPPDGRRGSALEVGGIVAFDMPEYASSVKLKAIAAPFAANTVTGWNVVLGWIVKY
jgi:hypothetical protein